MQRTPENIDWMIGLLEQFAHLKGYPPNSESLSAVAGHYLDIVHTGHPKELVSHIYTNDDKTINKAKSLGTVNPGEWLIKKLGQTCERYFPTPPVARAMYKTKWLPGDEASKSPYAPTDHEREQVEAM